MAKATKTPALNAQQIRNRNDFKAAYYGIADKNIAIRELSENVTDEQAARKLRLIRAKLEAVRAELESFGDRYLTNWD